MKKTLAVLVALAVFAAGTMLLVGYVRRAEEQVLAREEPVAVLVVSQPIIQGEPPIVRTEQIPARLVLEDAVFARDSLQGLVALVDLVPNEQLVWSRLGEPVEAEDTQSATRMEIPDGMLAVTISVGATQTLGGMLEPGMNVGVAGSFEIAVPDDLDSGDAEVELVADSDELSVDAVSPTTQATSILVHKALVVEVQPEVAPAPPPADPESPVQPLAPGGGFLVTLAGSAYDIERIIFAAEWGSIWLVEEDESADDSTSRIQTPSTIFTDFETLEPSQREAAPLASATTQSEDGAADVASAVGDVGS